MKEKGITLIALVITIIVLLILAGVSVSLALGNNGVLVQATAAVTKNKEETKREEMAFEESADAIKQKISNYLDKVDNGETNVNGYGLTVEKIYDIGDSNKSLRIIKYVKIKGDPKYYSVEKNNSDEDLVIKDAFIINQHIVKKDLYSEVGLTWGEWLLTPYNEDQECRAYDGNKVCKYEETVNDKGVVTGFCRAAFGYDVYNTSDIYAKTTEVISPDTKYVCVDALVMVDLTVIDLDDLEELPDLDELSNS